MSSSLPFILPDPTGGGGGGADPAIEEIRKYFYGEIANNENDQIGIATEQAGPLDNEQIMYSVPPGRELLIQYVGLTRVTTSSAQNFLVKMFVTNGGGAFKFEIARVNTVGNNLAQFFSGVNIRVKTNRDIRVFFEGDGTVTGGGSAFFYGVLI